MAKCPYSATAGWLSPGMQDVFALCGVLVILYFIAKTTYFFAKSIFVFFLAEPLGLTVKFKNLGEWAVVTGATDGIGKAYAFDLARRGCNIVLISRTLTKLHSVAREIETAYNVNTKLIAVDFASDEEIYERVKSKLEGLEIGTLINNVGMGYKFPENFHLVEGGEAFFLQMIRCNCVAQTMMTRIIIPQMVARGKGVIVNLSSGAGAIPIPMYAVYSATKAYNDFLGRALEQEYSDKGIIIQVVQPYVVATNMSGMRKANLFVIESQAYARSCLNTVGFLKRTNGHPSHAIQNWIATSIPSCLINVVLQKGLVKYRDAKVARLKRKAESKGQ